MKKDNGDILENTLIEKLQVSFVLMLDSITIDNHQVSIDNLYVTGDLAFLVILIGNEFSSSKWCFEYKRRPKVWLECGYVIGEDWTINTLILISISNSTSSTRLGVKESSIWECVEVDKYMCPVLRNQINLGNNVIYSLCDCGNEFIEKLTSNEQVARNSLSLIDGSINKKVILRQDFDISEEEKILSSLKNARRNYTILIINATESTNDREIEIYESIRKRDTFRNDVN